MMKGFLCLVLGHKKYKTQNDSYKCLNCGLLLLPNGKVDKQEMRKWKEFKKSKLKEWNKLSDGRIKEVKSNDS